jgi:hypothetical protein
MQLPEAVSFLTPAAQWALLQFRITRSGHSAVMAPVRSCKRTLLFGMWLTAFSTACL